VARRDSDATATVMRPTWDIDSSWQLEAGCRSSDANLFFAPIHAESKDDRVLREARAKSICLACKVRAACLDFALATRESHGIWGGLNELERRHALARKAV
jgi:WhiB family transcriptional regulator, redox-sensing transcriptional regulator